MSRSALVKRGGRWGSGLLVAGLLLRAARGIADDAVAYPTSVRRARIAASRRLRAPEPDERVHMSLTLRLRDREALAAMNARQQQPGMPEYRRWLSPAEFEARFAPTAAEHAAVAGWLREQGFEVAGGPTRQRLDFRGSVAAVEAAFGVRMGCVEERGRRVLANETAALLPRRLAAAVEHVRLDGFALGRPRARLTEDLRDVNRMAPRDVAVTYGALGTLNPHFSPIEGASARPL